jgi:hypothetical protein
MPLSKLIEFAVETLGAHSQPRLFAKISPAAFRGLLFPFPERSAFLRLEAITQDPRFSLIESRVVFAAPPNRLAIATHAALMPSR